MKLSVCHLSYSLYDTQMFNEVKLCVFLLPGLLFLSICCILAFVSRAYRPHHLST